MDATIGILLKEKGDRVHYTSPEMIIFECAKQITQLHVGALLVKKDEQILGIVSERDILIKVVAAKKNPNEITVADIMTTNLITISPATTVKEAMHIITEKHIRHLPVFEANKLVGIISIGDLMRWIMFWQEHQISSLTNYIHGEK